MLEAEDTGLHHTSARNSQVLHAGMLYPPGTLKAELCVKGKRMLFDFCATRHIDYAKCGKLVIASDIHQFDALSVVMARGEQNGINDLCVLSQKDALALALALEPELSCASAILSPSTGILDAPSFMRSMQGEAQADGAMFAYNAPLETVEVVDGHFLLTVGGKCRMQLSCLNLINAAGLGAWDVARNIKGFDPDLIPHRNHAKACYFSLVSGKSPFERLIYPVPNSRTFGVHALKDTSGQARFGPSLSFLNPPEINYHHDVSPEPFEVAIRKFWPNMPTNCLQPDTCGIRPRITPPNKPLADFTIIGPQNHRISGLIHLFGIESPGLTSSLAIAKYVERLL